MDMLTFLFFSLILAFLALLMQSFSDVGFQVYFSSTNPTTLIFISAYHVFPFLVSGFGTVHVLEEVSYICFLSAYCSILMNASSWVIFHLSGASGPISFWAGVIILMVGHFLFLSWSLFNPCTFIFFGSRISISMFAI